MTLPYEARNEVLFIIVGFADHPVSNFPRSQPLIFYRQKLCKIVFANLKNLFSVICGFRFPDSDFLVLGLPSLRGEFVKCTWMNTTGLNGLSFSFMLDGSLYFRISAYAALKVNVGIRWYNESYTSLCHNVTHSSCNVTNYQLWRSQGEIPSPAGANQ